MRRTLFTEDHELFRDAVRQFVEREIVPHHEAWERDGRTEFGLDRIANAWGPEIPLEFIEPADLADLQAGWAARA